MPYCGTGHLRCSVAKNGQALCLDFNCKPYDYIGTTKIMSHFALVSFSFVTDLLTCVKKILIHVGPDKPTRMDGRFLPEQSEGKNTNASRGNAVT